MISAEASAGGPGIQRVVGINLSAELNAHLERGVPCLDAGAHLVLEAAVRSSIEVAGGANRHSVAAPLHVPEKRLGNRDHSRLISHVVAEAGNFGDWNGAERRQWAYGNYFWGGPGILRTRRAEV